MVSHIAFPADGSNLYNLKTGYFLPGSRSRHLPISRHIQRIQRRGALLREPPPGGRGKDHHLQAGAPRANKQVTAELIKAGLLRDGGSDGGSVAAITVARLLPSPFSEMGVLDDPESSKFAPKYAKKGPPQSTPRRATSPTMSGRRTETLGRISG